jgi:hypothetical protein
MPNWHCCCGHCGKDPRDPKCGRSGGHCRDKFLLKNISQSLLAACDLGSETICLSIYPSICDTLTPSSGILSSGPLPFQGTGKRVQESEIQQRRAGGTVSHPTLPKQLFAEECLAVLACACEPGCKMLSLSIYMLSAPHYIHSLRPASRLTFQTPPLPSRGRRVSPSSRAETGTGERCHGTDSHAQNDVIISQVTAPGIAARRGLYYY